MSYLVPLTADTYVDSDHPYVNFGSLPFMLLKGTTRIPLLDYDINQLRMEVPPGQRVVRATLRLWLKSPVPASVNCDPNYELHRLSATASTADPWTENGVTFQCTLDHGLAAGACYTPSATSSTTCSDGTTCSDANLWQPPRIAPPLLPPNYDSTIIDTVGCSHQPDGSTQLAFDVTRDVVDLVETHSMARFYGWMIFDPFTDTVLDTDAAMPISALDHAPTLQVEFGPAGAVPIEPTPPPIDRSAPTHVFTAMSWLLNPALGLQVGVTDTIDRNRASLIRGNVYDRDTGTPLAGVQVSIVGHAGLGRAVTRNCNPSDSTCVAGRATGNYELLVNGGGPLTLEFAEPNHLPAQRTIDVPWNDWIMAPDVALVPRTELACATAAPGTLVRGTPRAQSPGVTRQLAMWLPSGTQVSTSSRTASIAQLCMGEYTLPLNTRESSDAMPAELPPTTSYTLAAGIEVVDGTGVRLAHGDFVGGRPVLYVLVNDPRLPRTAGDVVRAGATTVLAPAGRRSRTDES